MASRTLRLRAGSSWGHVNHEDTVVFQHPRKGRRVTRQIKLDEQWSLVISHCGATLVFSTKQKKQLLKFLGGR